MQDKMTAFKELMGEIWDLNMASALLGWDMQVNMPPKGAEDRGDILSTIARLIHQKSTSDEAGRLLEELSSHALNLDPDSDDACLIRRAKREYDKNTRVPVQWVAEFSRITAMAHEIWAQARQESNFALFQPYLQQIVDLRRQYSDFFKPYDHVYDPLLDDFEPGLKTAEVQAIFQPLRTHQVELIHAIAKRPQVNDSFLHLKYEDQKQWDFGVDVITHFGYDWQAGRQDRSAHPFTTEFGLRDVRITTRVIEDQLPSAMFGTMHESGHAMYEQGIDWKLRRTVLAAGASMAIHESQSRMWENLVGRSLNFWKFFYPSLQGQFPAQLGNVSLNEFYKGINKVVPSFIRVEADEATYNLHIMLRLELEIALMEGSLAVQDLPDAWNERMMDYLGIVPPDDRMGVLQDVHWSSGMIGYFPTYALGNLVSAQLWEVIQKDIPNLEEQFERGEFKALLDWLREKIHQHGAKFDPQDLVRRVTGSPIEAGPYINYLNNKYKEIYCL